MKKTNLVVTINKAFARVMHNCRTEREFKEGTWITDDMERAYNRLNELGFALSCEVWDEDRLVGGLYGVSIGRCFFGESMFSKVDNASKLALISLAQRLNELNFEFIDCQFHTPHLESMGGRAISYKEYIGMIGKGLNN
jgi:leucyl/phenylalanyl-tRNA--protein transferase